MRAIIAAFLFGSMLFVGSAGGQPPAPGVEGLEWNKYDVDQRVHVLALDDKQGKYLHQNFNNVKTWALDRWGLPDVEVASETRILCVTSRDQMKKLFKIEQSAVEYRQDGKGQNYTMVWLLCDDRPTRVIVGVITDVALTEYERAAGVRLPWYVRRGMTKLNGTIPDIRADITALNGAGTFDVRAVLEMTEADYKKLTPGQQAVFDRQAAVLLLLCRKEYGQVRTLEFIHGGPGGVTSVLGFRDFAHFNATYARYTGDLCREVAAGRTPDSYLDIRPVKRK